MAEDVLRLRKILQPWGPDGAIVLTDEQVARLGSTKTPPVRVTVAGVTVPARVGRMGGENLLGLSRKLQGSIRRPRPVAPEGVRTLGAGSQT